MTVAVGICDYFRTISDVVVARFCVFEKLVDTAKGLNAVNNPLQTRFLWYPDWLPLTPCVNSSRDWSPAALGKSWISSPALSLFYCSCAYLTGILLVVVDTIVEIMVGRAEFSLSVGGRESSGDHVARRTVGGPRQPGASAWIWRQWGTVILNPATTFGKPAIPCFMPFYLADRWPCS